MNDILGVAAIMVIVVMATVTPLAGEEIIAWVKGLFNSTKEQ